MRMRAIAHEDAMMYNIMKQLGPDNPTAKQWFAMKAEDAVEKLQARRAEIKRQQELQQEHDKKCAEENKKAREMLDLATTLVSPANSSLTISTGAGALLNLTVLNKVFDNADAINPCCAGDRCIVNNGHKKICAVSCGHCDLCCQTTVVRWIPTTRVSTTFVISNRKQRFKN